MEGRGVSTSLQAALVSKRPLLAFQTIHPPAGQRKVVFQSGCSRVVDVLRLQYYKTTVPRVRVS